MKSDWRRVDARAAAWSTAVRRTVSSVADAKARDALPKTNAKATRTATGRRLAITSTLTPRTQVPLKRLPVGDLKAAGGWRQRGFRDCSTIRPWEYGRRQASLRCRREGDRSASQTLSSLRGLRAS